jgi:hypothetical protein
VYTGDWIRIIPVSFDEVLLYASSFAG